MTRRHIAVAVGIAGVMVAATAVAWRYVVHQPLHPLIDLDVYKHAGRDVLAGRFGYRSGGGDLVFTYPPFAALVAVLTAPFGQWWGQFLWTLASTLALVGVVWLSFRRAVEAVGADVRPLLFGGACVLAVLARPFAEHVAMGQVNVFLVLACLVDLFAVRGRWPQGTLIGVASALKLTPAVFIVYLAVTGRLRAAGTAVAAFAACSGLAFVVLPAASIDYWSDAVFHGERVTGSLAYTSNQSVLGAVNRMVPAHARGVVWLVVSAAVVVIGLHRAREAHRAGDELGGVAVTAALGLLVSPISWLHHFVWLLPMVGALVADGRDRVRDAWAGVVSLLLLLPLGWWGWALLDDGNHALRAAGVLAHNALTLVTVVLVVGYRPPASEALQAASSARGTPVGVAG
ncbi:glycosyltransferase 87 family protein [Rhabdothermincola sediminis]|uniref:glycosyltransferase 87 family protein n=1 Tax=Rhabdothermincola sediminis TaxID=2751370 RepID=UPI001AA0A61D|nr:glycosyltransferase 87 family protein [Rhabdothermincola sediminis]